jgi:hypothetical protein
MNSALKIPPKRNCMAVLRYCDPRNCTPRPMATRIAVAAVR